MPKFDPQVQLFGRTKRIDKETDKKEILKTAGPLALEEVLIVSSQPIYMGYEFEHIMNKVTAHLICSWHWLQSFPPHGIVGKVVGVISNQNFYTWGIAHCQQSNI